MRDFHLMSGDRAHVGLRLLRVGNRRDPVLKDLAQETVWRLSGLGPGSPDSGEPEVGELRRRALGPGGAGGAEASGSGLRGSPGGGAQVRKPPWVGRVSRAGAGSDLAGDPGSRVRASGELGLQGRGPVTAWSFQGTGWGRTMCTRVLGTSEITNCTGDTCMVGVGVSGSVQCLFTRCQAPAIRNRPFML